MRKILVLLIAILLLCCATHTLGEKARLKCERIEGKVWRDFGGHKIVVITRGNVGYLKMIRALSNGMPVRVYRWSNLSDDERRAVENVLNAYSLPLRFPVVMVIGPPIIYINTGTPVIPPILKMLEKQHPYNLFSTPGDKYVFMFGYGVSPAMFSNEIRSLMAQNKTVAVYYPAPYMGFANSIIINKTLGLPLNSLIVLKGDKIVRITPLRYNITEILFFYSPYCPHCEKVMPYVKMLSKKAVVRMVNVTDEKNEPLINKYGVYAVPTLIVKTDKGEMTLVGEKSIIHWVDSYLKR